MSKIDATKKLIGAFVRMKPRPHDEMKVGKKVASKMKQQKKRRSAAS
jgi:hypothetical protein